MACSSTPIAATPLAQLPAPTIVGERVNSQGSRRAKELLLADGYDGLVQIAENQVEGGAHILDLCVALTERQDEAEQMRLLAKKISLALPAPLQIDSTEPDVMRAALEQIPGRAIVNSVNLEAGRAKLDTVVPLCLEHGAALIALTIDEESMAKTAGRKVEVAKRIYGYVVDEHGMSPEVLIFDALTFTLATGSDEFKTSAIETIAGIRDIKAALPGVKTSLGVSNVSFGFGKTSRAVLNSVFLHHCVAAGLDLAMVHPADITPYSEISELERELADDLVFNRREDATQRFIEHFEERGESDAVEVADPTAGMEPELSLIHISLGSSMSPAWPNTVLNTIAAEAIDRLAGEVDAQIKSGATLEKAILKVVGDSYSAHSRIVFNGDNYSESWHKEAEKRGLANLRSTPDALPWLVEKSTVDLFKKQKVLSKRELESRYEVCVEQYSTKVNIEAETAASMARTLLLPAALRHLTELKEAGIDSLITETHDLVAELIAAIGVLEHANAEHPDVEGLEHAIYMHETVLPAMDEVRAASDKLERIVADDLWPLPKYAEMLFIK